MVAIFIDVIGYKNTTGFEKKHELHRLFHEEVAIHARRQLEIPHVIYDRKVFGFSDCAYFFFYYKDGIEEEALLHKSVELVIPQTPDGITAWSPPQSWACQAA